MESRTPTGLFPGHSWPTGSARVGRVDPDVMGNATLILRGREVATYGSPGTKQTNWASTARSVATATAWGRAITTGQIPGGMAVLNRPVRDLPSARARTFSGGIKVKHLLSYTSQAEPPGSSWEYESGQHWPDQHVIFEEVVGVSVADYCNRELFNVLGGGLHAVMKVEDGTARVHGSPRDLARWGYLWLMGGRWNGQQLLDPDYVARAIGGGPDGDGKPSPREGYQIHLFKHGEWTEGPALGVPDDAFMAAGDIDVSCVLVVPSLEMVCVRHRSEHGVPFGTFASEICRAVNA